jgi:hypothetical protein
LARDKAWSSRFLQVWGGVSWSTQLFAANAANAEPAAKPDKKKLLKKMLFRLFRAALCKIRR